MMALEAQAILALMHGLAYLAGGIVASMAQAELDSSRKYIEWLITGLAFISSLISLMKTVMIPFIAVLCTVIVTILVAAQKKPEAKLSLIPLLALIAILSMDTIAISLTGALALFIGIISYEKNKEVIKIWSMKIRYYYATTLYLIITSIVLLIAAKYAFL